MAAARFSCRLRICTRIFSSTASRASFAFEPSPSMSVTGRGSSIVFEKGVSEMATHSASPSRFNRRSVFDSIEWTIFVCSEVLCKPSQPLAILVPDAKESWTVASIKKEIQKKINLPVYDQVIYFNEIELTNDQRLLDCEGISDGAAVLLCRQPYYINVYRSDADVTVSLEVSMSEAHNWTITVFKKYILDRVVGVSTAFVLAIGDQILEDSNTLVSQNTHIDNGCRMVLTLLQLVSPVGRFGPTDISIPRSFSTSFMTKHAFNGRILDSPKAADTSWTLQVQQFEGSVMSIQIPEKGSESIIDLKKKISITSRQHKLTIGKEVLEDYDEDGTPLLLCDYPAIHDGAMLVLSISSSSYL